MITTPGHSFSEKASILRTEGSSPRSLESELSGWKPHSGIRRHARRRRYHAIEGHWIVADSLIVTSVGHTDSGYCGVTKIGVKLGCSGGGRSLRWWGWSSMAPSTTCCCTTGAWCSVPANVPTNVQPSVSTSAPTFEPSLVTTLSPIYIPTSVTTAAPTISPTATQTLASTSNTRSAPTLPPTLLPACKMAIYDQTYFRGKSVEITENVNDFITIKFDNSIASVKVEGNCCWTLFADKNYQGASIKLKIGEYQSATNIIDVFKKASSAKNYC